MAKKTVCFICFSVSSIIHSCENFRIFPYDGDVESVEIRGGVGGI